MDFENIDHVKKQNKRNSMFKLVGVLVILALVCFAYWWFFLNDSSDTGQIVGGATKSLSSAIRQSSSSVLREAPKMVTKTVSRVIPKQYLNLGSLNSTIKKFNSLINS